MGEEESNRPESRVALSASEPPPTQVTQQQQPLQTQPLPPPQDQPHSPLKPTHETDEKLEDDAQSAVSKEESTVILVSNKLDGPVFENAPRKFNDRDAALAQVVAEKRVALIKAWEESEKTKADNKAYKRFSAVAAWEDTKKAAVEAELKKLEEKIERKKAEYAEKMKNRVAEIHQAAEEKRAMVEAKRKEEIIKVEESAATYCAKGSMPRRFLGWFSS